MITDDELRAMTVNERWVAYNALKSAIQEIELEEARERFLAVPGRPAPKHAIGDHFVHSGGTSVYKINHFAWDETYGCWRYWGRSPLWGVSFGVYERDVYYRCFTLLRCDADGKIGSIQAQIDEAA